MTPIEYFCDWVNKRDSWVKEIARLSLKNQEITPEQVESAYEIAEMEFDLKKECANFSQYEKKVIPVGYADNKDHVELKSIGKVRGVGLLDESSGLEFKDGLTVVYGDNGTGKSSYTRILKNACLTRGAPPQIKSNIFSDKNHSPEAEFIVSNNGVETNLTWTLFGDESYDLKSIRVFDNSTAENYITKSEEISYSPVEFKILDVFSSSVLAVLDKCQGNIRGVSNLRSDLDPMFLENSGGLIISRSLSENQLDSFCIKDSEITELVRVESKLKELSRSTPEEIIRHTNLKTTQMEKLLQLLEKSSDIASDKNIAEIIDLYRSSIRKKIDLDTLKGGNDQDLERLSSSTWVAMWKAARNYSKEDLKLSFPPVEGQNCPLCDTKVDAVSAGGFSSFNSLIESTLQKDLDTITSKLGLLQCALSDGVLELEPYETLVEELCHKRPELKKSLNDFVVELNSRVSYFSNVEPCGSYGTVNRSFLSFLEKQIKSNKDYIDELNGSDSDKAIEKLEQEKIRLVAKSIVKDNREKIIEQVEVLKTNYKLERVGNTINKTMLTSLGSKISSYSNLANLESEFSNELSKFGFKNIEVVTKQKGSNQKQRLSLAIQGSSSKLSDIVSEGEAKCIALAGFFAELNIDNRMSAIVLDDPVTSFDHNWRSKFAKRIYEESTLRQVVVFTHDISFLMNLKEVSGGKANVCAISRNPSVVGLPMSSPPWVALSTGDRKGELNNMYQKLKAEEATLDQDSLNEKIATFYSKLRSSWERLVEEWLIRRVVERFGRVVQTSNIRYLIDIEQKDVDLISSAMTKASTFTDAHDTAKDIGVDMPDLLEVSQDLDLFSNFFKEIKKRRP